MRLKLMSVGVWVLCGAALAFALGMPLQATSRVNYHCYADGETFTLGVEASLTFQITPPYEEGPCLLYGSQWVEHVSVSFKCQNCSSSVLAIVIADGKPLYTPHIVAGTPMPCIEGACFTNVQAMTSLPVQRWVQSLTVRIESTGTGTYELQVVGSDARWSPERYQLERANLNLERLIQKFESLIQVLTEPQTGGLEPVPTGLDRDR